MGTRSGDIDPGVFAFLAERAGMDVGQVTDALNHESGLLGLSALSNDMRAILTAREHGDRRAALAVDVFVYRLAKAIAGLVVAIERLDVLVFTGGIGENSSTIRSLVIDRLSFLSLNEDEEANRSHGRRTRGRISQAGGVVAMVIPTDEEAVIAADTSLVISTEHRWDT